MLPEANHTVPVKWIRRISSAFELTGSVINTTSPLALVG